MFEKGNNFGTINKCRKDLRREITWEADKNGCWICTSHKPNTYGYPQCKINGKIKVISRVMYEREYGEIPKGMIVCHKCDNPNCINLDHLFLGTNADNSKDMVKKNRQSRQGSPGMHGTKHPQAKLTEKQVIEIRSYKGLTDKQIAEIYKVSITNINNIRNRKIWTHI